MLVFAADYPFLDVLWTMLIFFTWVIWIWMMVVILSDLFRRRDIGGWRKAVWCVFMIVLPFIGVLTYLILQHDGFTERNREQMERSQRDFDSRVRAASHNNGAGAGAGAASEIETAAQLRSSGAITQSEFEALKAKAIART